MPRFYSPEPLAIGIVSLDKDTAHHIQVLRLRLGDAVSLFNGDGNNYQAVLRSLDKPVSVEIISALPANTELPVAISLAQGLVEPSKMDWLIEKAVELGVQNIYPIAAARSVTKLDETRAAKRLAHWHALAIAASQQCGRSVLISVEQPLGVKATLLNAALFKINSISSVQQTGQNTSKPHHLLMHPEGGISLQQWCATHPPHPVCLWVGPEGGWSPAELAELESAGAQRVHFGTRVLRTETAGLAVAAAIQALWC